MITEQLSMVTLDVWCSKNKIYGFTINTKNPEKFIYKYLIMYRNNKKEPETLYVVMSKKTKMVLDIYTDNKKFKSFDELKKQYQLNI